MTFGHEPAVVVAELGEGVTGVEVGDNVIVYGCWGCGVCAMCADGSENSASGEWSHRALVVTARWRSTDRTTFATSVPIGDLDPVRAASLTDAALTPLPGDQEGPPSPGRRGDDHGRHRGRWPGPRRHPAASDHYADAGGGPGPRRREAGVREGGWGHTRPSSPSRRLLIWIRELTGGRGADDCPRLRRGIDPTGDLALKSVGVGGRGPRRGWWRQRCRRAAVAPFDVQVSTSLWGRRRGGPRTRRDGQARRRVHRDEIRYSPTELALQAYDDLTRPLRGRGVIVP